MDTRTHCTLPEGSAEVINLVPLHDGSLKKRCGYSLLASLGEDVRAIWTGRICGKETAFILAASNVYSLDLSTAAKTLIGSVDTSDTDADFFCYGGCVYLVDGSRIYNVSSGTLEAPYGYVPLVGKDWRDTYIGEPYEPRNLLNNKGRISYIISEDPSSFLKTDAPISAIDAIYVNGTLIDSSRYAITAMPRTVHVSDLVAYDRVEMYFTYSECADATALASLLSSTSAIVFGGITNTRPFLWGSSDASLMFSSRFVTPASLAEARVGFPESDTLYFPVGYEFCVGDGRSGISAVSRHYDRLLIFTEEGAWMANSSACGVEDFPTLNINSAVGTASRHGAALLGNTPLTVSRGAIMRWSSETDMLDECNASSISHPIVSRLPESLFENGVIFADRREQRLLLTSPALDGIVWVWYAEHDAWVSFDLGIGAERFFEAPRGIGFISSGSLYVFDDDAYTDAGGREIVGRFDGNLCDFGKHGDKRIFSAAVCCDGDVTLECRLDSDALPSVSIDMSGGAHESVRRRIRTRRFTTLHPSLTARGAQRQVIHSLRLMTN